MGSTTSSLAGSHDVKPDSRKRSINIFNRNAHRSRTSTSGAFKLPTTANMVAPMAIILPLYIYPSSGAWNTLTTSIKANPNLQFMVVVNPNSGPGSTKYPDSNYIANIATLNAASNVKTLGYVHTEYAGRAAASVQADINSYANWAYYAASNIKMDGIFFDEVPTAAANVAYMQKLTTYARGKFSSSTLVLNPGAVPAAQYYTLADYVAAFEGDASGYNANTLGTVAAAKRAASAFIMYNYKGTQAAQTAVVKALSKGGLGALFISTQDDYNVWSSMWPAFCASMTAALARTG